ncbi:MAG TPA: transcriptional regulator [Nitrosopumilaceae archaeon]|nr:transcriptional regulator [Nitrosopumilaceae archaeon]
MVGVDSLLAKSVGLVISENLSEKTLQKVDSRLFEKYGITITQSLQDFQKLDSVLREFFGAGADGLEKKIFENVCTLEKPTGKEQEWMTVEDQHLSKIILEAFGDEDKKKILTALVDEPRIISEVLDMCNIPQTSGYRKINSLIDDGMLTPRGFITARDGKKVNKYVSVFENVKIDIVKNKISVKVQLSEESLKASTMIPLIKSL